MFVRKIIEWYELNGRKHLPWRNASDAWEVLIAGMLLRKTTSGQVERIFSKFVKKYPTPLALSNAPIAEVRNIISSLGMANVRTKQLIKIADQLHNNKDGIIPTNFEELTELYGVGNYIASEIFLIAYDIPKALLDTNMIRVLNRVFSVEPSRKRAHTDPKLWKFANSIVPYDPLEARKYNFGVLDFASSVCKARNPSCDSCIISNLCDHINSRTNEKSHS